MIMMKYLLVLGCLTVAALAETYPDKYDNINLDEILTNDRLLNAHVDCVMENGKCTPEGKELKEHLQDAIETGCEKCTKAQEEGATKVIEYLIEKKPEIWKKLCDKFDPEGKWRKKYEDQAKAKGIVIPK